MVSAAELAAVFNLTNLSYVHPEILCARTVNATDAAAAMPRLGGTVKIAVELGEDLSKEQLLQTIEESLREITGKIHFGLSVYENAPTELARTWGLELKKRLKEQGRSVRHVYNREAILSSVTVEKNGLTRRGGEFIIVEGKAKKFALAKTLAVQPFEAFGERDFGRPGRDELSGMLPPKLALMMLNLAKSPQNEPLLDPFCGSGTILSEALLLGYTHLFGLDISPKAILDSQKNIDWLADVKQIAAAKPKLTVGDAAELEKIFAPGSIQAIVTEPFLGEPRRGTESKEKLLNQIQELKKIYLRAFTSFARIMRKGATVTIIIPRFKLHSEWLIIDCATDIQALGFSPDPLLVGNNFLLYARNDQLVGREIWRFVKV